MLQKLQIFKNKELIHSIYKLAWPTVIQEALAVLVQYVDTAMVGMIGASASAAVGLTGSVNWLVGSICMAFGIGVLATISKAHGANNLYKMQQAAIQSIFITLVVGIVVGVIALLVSPYLPIWLGADTSIQQDASIYFFIISLPLVCKAATFIFGSALRAIGDTKSPMLINVLMNVINVVLNFLLIYPTRDIYGITIYGANLGTAGAAIGTAISFIVGGILMFYLLLKNQQLQIKKVFWRVNVPVLKECISIGTPVCMERIVICGGHIFFASLVSRLGVISLAAHSIALTAEQAFYVPGYGMQAAVSTLSGNALGQRNEQRIKDISFITMILTFVSLSILGLLLFIFAPVVMRFFTNDVKVIELGSTILRIVSISEPLFGILIILEGVFNGIGDTKAPFIYSCMTMWGVRIVGSIFVINVLHLGVEAVWVMMVLDNVCRCLLLSKRFIQGKWKIRMLD